jgi:putative DNA methylase
VSSSKRKESDQSGEDVGRGEAGGDKVDPHELVEFLASEIRNRNLRPVGHEQEWTDQWKRLEQERAELGSERRLIEDFLPIDEISKEAAREKSVRKGHISTLHLWWARRPLVAARAAVYATLVPATQFLDHAAARDFVCRLCKYPGDPQVIAEAQKHILMAHAERLTRETGQHVSVRDIELSHAPRPKVLDMFAGGGSIPFEALRLGCEAHALDLNPVAHIVELCTLVYPQMFGKPDTKAKGSAPDGTWAGLAAEVEHWGKWVLEMVKIELSDLYPPIPDPDAPAQEIAGEDQGTFGFAKPAQGRLKTGGRMLTPVAYLWSRTVRCKNGECGALVPLVGQTWMCKKPATSKKPGRFIALRVVLPSGQARKEGKRVKFEVVESTNERGLGFDPSDLPSGGGVCPFCGTVADRQYLKIEGQSGRLGHQMMAVACSRRSKEGKIYFSADDWPTHVPDEIAIRVRIERLLRETRLTIPDEPVLNDSKGALWAVSYGISSWADVFSPRQMLCLLTFASVIKRIERMLASHDQGHRQAVMTFLAALLDRQADFLSMGCHWNPIEGERTANTFSRSALPMLWDYSETAPFNTENAGWPVAVERVVSAISSIDLSTSAIVNRGSATSIPMPDSTIDAVVTDPPYYDNVPYAAISDFFYVWLKRSIGHIFPEHFAASGTPKKNEAVADATRHGGDRKRANSAYEGMMAQAFAEAFRVLKSNGQLAIVYAHKTTLGWSTLVEALRRARFTVTEAWPLDTEKPGRVQAQDTASLASSIFLVARKRAGSAIGSYEEGVRPELEHIVRERVTALWNEGILGGDLIIAAVGAGLRAFTRFERVEYASGEEVPAERFLAEVEGVVLETMLEKIFGFASAGVAAVDGPSRFYVLYRYAYRAAELDAGEAIVFTYGQPVELDGPNGLTSGKLALVEKKKGKYRLRDFTERGKDARLGLPDDDGNPAPLIDVLHRVLWLMENQPRSLGAYVDEADPDLEQLRLLAQALSGAGLKGKGTDPDKLFVTTTPTEQSALGKLTANWRALMETHTSAQMRLTLGDRDPGKDPSDSPGA